MNTFLTLNVWNVNPLEAISISVDNDWKVSGKPYQHQVKVVNEATERIIKFSVVQRDNATRASHRAFYDARQGQYGAFWYASHHTDYTLVNDAPSGQSYVIVQAAHDVTGLAAVTRYVYIPALDSGHLISSAVAASDDVRLNLSPAIGGNLITGNSIQSLYLVRFDMPLEFEVRSTIGPLTTSDIILHEIQGETAAL